MSNPNEFSDKNPYQPVKHVAKGNVVGEGDATGGVIPYKNPHALIAYYLGIGSCVLPVIGLIGGIAAIVLGIIGLVKRQKNPVIKGSVHAFVGIFFGLIAMFINGICTVAIIAGLMSSP